MWINVLLSLSLPFVPLPHLPFFSLLPSPPYLFPSLSFHCKNHKFQLKGLENAVSSPNGVWGGRKRIWCIVALVTHNMKSGGNNFDHFLQSLISIFKKLCPETGGCSGLPCLRHCSLLVNWFFYFKVSRAAVTFWVVDLDPKETSMLPVAVCLPKPVSLNFYWTFKNIFSLFSLFSKFHWKRCFASSFGDVSSRGYHPVY